MIDISIWGVIAAATSAMLIGTVWYSPILFGKAWQKAIGLKDSEMRDKAGSAMVTLVIASLLTAYILAHFVVMAHAFYSLDWLTTGITTGFWAWLGIGGTAIVAHGVFEPRSKAVMYINLANRLVTLLGMGIILGVFYGMGW